MWRGFVDDISVSYIGTLDTTISGSRNAITPVFLWYALSRMGRAGLSERARRGLELAEYAIHELGKTGKAAWRKEHALTVIFPQPSEKICYKWQLPSENCMSHLICMPGITKDHIDSFVSDCKEWNEHPINCKVEAVNYSLN